MGAILDERDEADLRDNTVQLGWAASVSGGLTGWRRANHLAMGGGRRDDFDRLVDIEGRQRRVALLDQFAAKSDAIGRMGLRRGNFASSRI
jgi:hypothetical protein